MRSGVVFVVQIAFLIATSTLGAQDFRQQLLSRMTKTQACQLFVLESLGVDLRFEPTYERASYSHDNKLFLTTSPIKYSFALPTQGPYKEESWRAFLSPNEGLAGLWKDKAYYLFKLKIAEAIKIAAKKMAANVNCGNAKFGTQEKIRLIAEMPSSEWQKRTILIDGEARSIAIPKTKPSSAYQCFYNQKCMYECWMGRRALDGLTLLEAMGPEDFDRTFKKEDFIIPSSVALFDVIKKFPNPVSDDPKNRSYQPLDKLYLGVLGLIGEGGYLGAVDKDRLDNQADQGENFNIVDISSVAFESIKQAGGLRETNNQLHKIWEAADRLSQEERRKFWMFEWRQYTEGTLKLDEIPESHRKLISLMDTPVLTQTIVYTHPLGLLTLAQHTSRLLYVNPRTPYSLGLGASTLGTTQFDAFMQAKLTRCVENPHKFLLEGSGPRLPLTRLSAENSLAPICTTTPFSDEAQWESILDSASMNQSQRFEFSDPKPLPPFSGR